MHPDQLKNILEAALMAAEEPLNLNRLQALFVEDELQPTKNDIQAAIAELQRRYDESSIELLDLASGYCFRVKKEYAKWVTKLWEMKPPRYSRALLETLALIVYKQPITRAEIEEVRGVAVSTHIIKTLVEREWIKEVGHKDVPGKPSLFATTKEFLDHFNLKSLTELPPLADIQDLDKIGEQLEIGLHQAAEISLEVAEQEIQEPPINEVDNNPVEDNQEENNEVESNERVYS